MTVPMHRGISKKTSGYHTLFQVIPDKHMKKCKIVILLSDCLTSFILLLPFLIGQITFLEMPGLLDAVPEKDTFAVENC